MPSEFDDALAEAFAEASDFLGTELLRIEGAPFAAARTVKASIDELGTTETLELNGRSISYHAVAQVAVSQFTTDPKAGQTVKRLKTGKTYRIVGEVHKDTLTFTFPLETIHQ